MTYCDDAKGHRWGNHPDYPLHSHTNRKCKDCDAQGFTGPANEREKLIENMILDSLKFKDRLLSANYYAIALLLCLDDDELQRVMKGPLKNRLFSLMIPRKGHEHCCTNIMTNPHCPNLMFLAHYAMHFNKEGVEDVSIFRREMQDSQLILRYSERSNALLPK